MAGAEALEPVQDLDEEVARRATSRVLDSAAVKRYAKRLTDVGIDAAAFKAVLDDILSDESLRAGELVAIANEYAIGGSKITSRGSAIKRIKHRFVEIQRTEGNVKIAKGSRPW